MGSVGQVFSLDLNGGLFKGGENSGGSRRLSKTWYLSKDRSFGVGLWIRCASRYN